MTAPLLRVDGARIQYGQTVAIESASIEVNEGEIVALLGRNGAGKTSLALSLSRIVPLAAGRITFDGQDITRLSAERVSRSGLLHVPEGRGVLRNLTVKENLTLGPIAARRRSSGIAVSLDEVLDVFPRLRDRLGQYAGSLSGGEQQMLVLGRALLGRPRLLVLDEPSLGLAPQIVRQIFDVFGTYSRRGMAVLLIEQNLALSLEVAARGYVLSEGRVAMQGTAAELQADPRLQAAYFGGDIANAA